MTPSPTETWSLIICREKLRWRHTVIKFGFGQQQYVWVNLPHHIRKFGWFVSYSITIYDKGAQILNLIMQFYFRFGIRIAASKTGVRNIYQRWYVTRELALTGWCGGPWTTVPGGRATWGSFALRLWITLSSLTSDNKWKWLCVCRLHMGVK